MRARKILTASALMAALMMPGQSASAQQDGQAGAQMPGMGQGMMGQGMMGQGMMGRGMQGSMMQGGMMGGDCPMMGMMMGGGQSTFAEGRIAFLRAELAITDAQKEVFDDYAKALKANLENMHAMRQGMMGMMGTMGTMAAKTPVERLDAHLTMMEGRLQALREVKPKLEALYASLSEEQKKKADTLLTGMGCMM